MIKLSDTVATYVGFSPDGNIIDTFNLKEGESLKHEKQKSEEQKKYLKNLTEIGKMTDDLGGFYMLYYSDKLFDGKISDKHITRIIYLATYIEYDTNRLAYTQQGKKPIPLTERDIKRELDIDRKTYYDFRSEMTSNGIMIFKDNEIYLSKQYFNKGTEQEKDLFFTKMYINTIRELYSQISPKQHKTLAHLTLPVKPHLPNIQSPTVKHTVNIHKNNFSHRFIVYTPMNLPLIFDFFRPMYPVHPGFLHHPDIFKLLAISLHVVDDDK